MAKPNHYLQNSTLLEQIHLSKVTYCSYLDRKDADFDVIVNSLDEVTVELLDDVIEDRWSKERAKLRTAYRLANNGKNYGAEYNSINPEKAKREDIVIRLMTWEHIPPVDRDPAKPVPAQIARRYVPLPFNPFKHFKLCDGEFKEVCRSHWQGGLDNGYFSMDHGKLTNRLGRAFMLLVDRYAKRGNWRGYSYNEEMRGEGLVSLVNGALKFDESKSSNPFAYYTVTLQNAFTKVLNSEKALASLKDDMREDIGQAPSSARAPKA